MGVGGRRAVAKYRLAQSIAPDQEETAVVVNGSFKLAFSAHSEENVQLVYNRAA